MTAREERCPRCDRPRAKENDHDGGCLCADCSSVCWAEWGNNECGVPVVDWRARCLAAEARLAVPASVEEAIIRLEDAAVENAQPWNEGGPLAESARRHNAAVRAMYNAARLALTAAIARHVPEELAGLLRALVRAEEGFTSRGMIDAVYALTEWTRANLPPAEGKETA